MVSQKKLKEANVPRHYPLHTFSLHVSMFLAEYKYPTSYNKKMQTTLMIALKHKCHLIQINEASNYIKLLHM
jgi:hypothetical protein